MKKSIWVFAIFGVLLGSGLGFLRAHKAKDPLVELFPPEKLKGYVENVSIRIASNLKQTSINGKKSLQAEAVSPLFIPPEKLEATCLAILQGVLRQNKDFDWITIYLAEDTSLSATSNWLAVAEYQAGKITIRGGPPTPAQCDSLQTLGITVIRPDAKTAALINAVFSGSPGLKLERWKLSQNLRGATEASLNKEQFFQLSLNTKALAEEGKKFGLTAEKTRQQVMGITRYYWQRAGVPWPP